jgi:hypothetical protein
VFTGSTSDALVLFNFVDPMLNSARIANELEKKQVEVVEVYLNPSMTLGFKLQLKYGRIACERCISADLD